MIIDFHTEYKEGEHINLWNNAIKHRLDALVMTGLPEKRQLQYHNLTVFPADLVMWNAALEIPAYATREDFIKKKITINEETNVFHGKALVLLPSNKSEMKYDTRLFQLLEQVRSSGGVTIALQDDSNWPITNAYIDKDNLYSFDAIRIRPYNSHDIHSEMPFAKAIVAGSGAKESFELENGAFTVFKKTIYTTDDLIFAVKNRVPTRLLVRDNNRLYKIEDTAKPLKTVISKELIRKLFEN